MLFRHLHPNDTTAFRFLVCLYNTVDKKWRRGFETFSWQSRIIMTVGRGAMNRASRVSWELVFLETVTNGAPLYIANANSGDGGVSSLENR